MLGAELPLDGPYGLRGSEKGVLSLLRCAVRGLDPKLNAPRKPTKHTAFTFKLYKPPCDLPPSSARPEYKATLHREQGVRAAPLPLSPIPQLLHTRPVAGAVALGVEELALLVTAPADSRLSAETA